MHRLAAPLLEVDMEIKETMAHQEDTRVVAAASEASEGLLRVPLQELIPSTCKR